MMISKINGAALVGIESFEVSVESWIKASHKEGFFIVGMADQTIRESKKRIKAALEKNHIDLSNILIGINLAPASQKKIGTYFDLPICVAILHALERINIPLSYINESIFVGELSFDGSVLPIKGIISIIIMAKKSGKKRIILPYGNLQEASLIKGIEIIPLKKIEEVFDGSFKERGSAALSSHYSSCSQMQDFNEVKGQITAKRMMQVAAVGNHPMLLVGPPGCGKTMLAERFSLLLPSLTEEEMIETTQIYSSAGLLAKNLVMNRPFRAPHHTVSYVGLIGGGNPIMPGEISLAHNGVLFLDELTEFSRKVLDTLRQPLEKKYISISRSNTSLQLPSNFLFIGALNPCPCGYAGDTQRQCVCVASILLNYLNKISGPFLDRIDLQLFIPSVNIEEINGALPQLSTDQLKEGVERGRWFKNKNKCSLSLDDKAELFLKKIVHKGLFSMRSYNKLITISRTIADIEESTIIKDHHLKEALGYRSLEKKIEQLKKEI